jgi:drug/metabolite transporter (DMT)-like permease
MIVAQLFFTLMIVLVKIARAELSGFEIALWRGVGSIPLLLLFCRGNSWNIAQKEVLLLRILFGFAALSSFYIAAKSLTVADLAMIVKIMPILVALSAPFVLGAEERPEHSLWWVMFLALCGCALLLAPSFELGVTGGLWALSAALFSSMAHLALRALKNESPWAVVLWFQLGVVVLALGSVLLHKGFIPIPPARLWLHLLGVGVFAALGQLCMTAAYGKSKASTVAAASYVGPVWAVAADALFFSFAPTWNLWVGGAILIFSGLWLSLKV